MSDTSKQGQRCVAPLFSTTCGFRLDHPIHQPPYEGYRSTYRGMVPIHQFTPESAQPSAPAEPLAPYDPRNIGVVVEPFVTNQAPAEPSAGMSPEDKLDHARQYLFDHGLHYRGLFSAMLPDGGVVDLAELVEAYAEYRVKELNNDDVPANLRDGL